VREANLATLRRLGGSERAILDIQSNLANSYGQTPGRVEQALQMRRDVYSGYLKLVGEHGNTLIAALNYAATLHELERYVEVKTLLRKIIPVARRVLGESHQDTLKMRWNYARAIYHDEGATLDDLREAVTKLEDLAPTARRVLGGAHPLAKQIEQVSLRDARAVLRARETPSPGSA